MALWVRFLTSFWAIALVMSATQRIAGASDNVGVQQLEAASKERGGKLSVTVWYPASSGGKPVTLGENRLLVGTSAMLDAPISDGRFPLILVSHGAGLAGNAQAVSWIAAALAERGFIVAAPTHPGSGGADRSAAETMKLWLRPADISETLDRVGGEPSFATHLARGEVGVLGLSMGGSTALALAGARFDPMRLASYCDTNALNPSLCDWVRQSGVDLHAMDMRIAGRNNVDDRIRISVAIDPVPVDVFDFATFSEIAIPVKLVNLGRPWEIPATAQASDTAKAIPDAGYSTIEDASHYSMFAECKPGAAETAEAEHIGDPICSDGEGRSRRAIHAQIIDFVTAAFRRTLLPAR